ncbi:hypothetical protein MXB_1273 [Myxobolus squamalis]|nr:hypothetical protein MXB_1273 [Myxobolus squamalis]
MSEWSKLVFEVSLEVVNKGTDSLIISVGGIHTVIRTKAEETIIELKDSYFLIGPYNAHQALTEVEMHPLKNKKIQNTVENMRSSGINISTGTWSIPGNPKVYILALLKVILFDVSTGYSNIDGWRFELHEQTKMPLHVFDKEVSDSIVFGGLVAWFLGDLRNSLGHNLVVLGHFHEWNSSVGLIFLRNRNVDIGLIFTTHATLIGRHLSSGGCDLYNKLKNFDCDFEAGKRGIYSNYCIERCAAHRAHVFTTVSNITAEEAEAFLGRYPDVITPNGLPTKNYVYEYSNKGVDVLLEAAYRLNNIIKAQNLDITVVLFLIFNGKCNNFNIESLKNQATVRQLRHSVDKIQAVVGERIFESVMFGKIPDPKQLLHAKEITELKKFLLSSRNGSALPPVVTHNMLDDENDPILCTLRRLKLLNSVDDRVKVVFHPQFLTLTSPLFPIDYESFVCGCHMGIFPSYYEPWGYTPAECTKMGIPSMTTNLSGFGQFMEDHVKHLTDYGIYVIDRRTRSLEESINQMTHHMYNFVLQSRKERIMQRNRCERLTEILEWKKLNLYYSKARILAVERTHPDKLKFFKQFDDSCLNFQRIERSLSLTSPKMSEYSSEDEYCHLWGEKTDRNHLKGRINMNRRVFLNVLSIKDIDIS